MQYGTQKSTGPFRLTLRLGAEPRCPGCAEYLQPCVVEYREGWAWCQPCIVMGLHLEPWIAVVLEGESIRERSAVVNGLRFYVPDLSFGPVQTAYECYEDAVGAQVHDHAVDVTIPDVSTVTDEPDGLYLQVPGGIAPIAELDMTGLRELEEVLQRRRAFDVPKTYCRQDDVYDLTSHDEQELLELDAPK